MKSKKQNSTNDSVQNTSQAHHEKEADIRRAAIDVHLAEMHVVRDELTRRIELQHQVLNYSIALIGAFAVLFSTFAADKISIDVSLPPLLYLGASLIASSLNWAILESAVAIAANASYIRYELGAKIEALLGREYNVNYQVFRHVNGNIPGSIAGGLLSMGKYFIPWASSVVFLGLYYYSSTGIPSLLPANIKWAEIYLSYFAFFAALVAPPLSIVFRIWAYYIGKRSRKK